MIYRIAHYKQSKCIACTASKLRLQRVIDLAAAHMATFGSDRAEISDIRGRPISVVVRDRITPANDDRASNDPVIAAGRASQASNR